MIDPTAAQTFTTAAALETYHQNRLDGVRYGRDGSINTLECEAWFESRYPGRKAVLFSSGMSACTAVLDVMWSDGRTLYVPHEHYRKLRSVLSGQRDGVYREYSSLDEIEPDGALVWVESPSNPHLKVADYDRLVELQESGALLVGDLTLAGLCNYQGPAEFDAEIHSCTKYAGGHNDLMAGVAIVSPSLREALWDRRSYGGGICDPFSAYLLGRSLKTYDIRIRAQLAAAREVASWLQWRVPIFYPNTQHHRHSGAVVSFRAGFSDGLTEAVANLKTAKMAPNFGGVETTIEVCATMSHYGKSEERLRKAGIEPDLVRLSVGIEPTAEIIADLRTLLRSEE